ncbi:DUF2897 family protein [Vibrio lamellibrachiae]|uniref:DUF2897 family protein n=1 Tax=Vibrio lamellibrachiae TaxID=2910253 RepID=UPI003D10C220
MDLLTNPWVISFLAMGFMVSNIMALKWVSKLKIGQPKKDLTKKKDPSDELEPADPNANIDTDTDTDTDTEKK